ncbi:MULTISPECIES: flagellar biosynthetic protein FliO [unclassified Paenibacillus]|uniref:flagellar biosynthetic protein FliO n=1 Tax=unclassified Paenibacillus TaxID=185978 RepID=UPI00093166F1|nr:MULTISPECIES: flagellar biosynthetic protein FliO [unclassified Paenibacillus]
MKKFATKTMLAVFAAWIQTVVFAAVCYGEAGTKEPGSSPFDSPDSLYSSGDTFGMVVKVIFFLIVIIVIFFVIMKIISQKSKILSGRSIRSLGGLPLGPNKSIQVVEIGRSLYIIGVGDNVQLLEKIADEQEVAIITESMAAGTAFSGPTLQSVGEWLKNRRQKPEMEEELDSANPSFQHVFQNKMTERKRLMEELLQKEPDSDGLKDKS